MNKLGIIVCNNGLGHLKRVLCVLKELCRNVDIQTDIYCDSSNLQFLTSETDNLQRNRNQIRFIDTNTDVLSYEKVFLKVCGSSLEKYDCVWSDNLVFPLRHRKDTVLSGSFFWSDVYQDNSDFKDDEEKLLSENHPEMIGNKYFATDRVKKLSRFWGVGIYNYLTLELSSKKRGSLLLSCGRTKTGRAFFRNNIESIKRKLQALSQDVKIYIEPDFYQAFRKLSTVYKATFNEAMFQEVSAAVIRPGMGTICDVLSKGGRILAFCEKDNFEIKHNASVLESLGIGKSCGSIESALVLAIEYLSDDNGQKEQLSMLEELDFNGVTETALKIKEILDFHE